MRIFSILQNESLSPTLGVDWLVRLRWLALIAQVSLLLFGAYYSETSLPVLPLGLIIATLALSNALLQWSEPRLEAKTPGVIGGILVLDAVLLAGLLYWTGGPTNPFSVFFLVHITLAAVVLGSGWTWALAVLASVMFTFLFYYHKPLPLLGGHAEHGIDPAHQEFSLHLQGMLAAFILTALLIAYFVTRVTRRLRRQEEVLRTLQRRKLDEERLASLTTLSAGAAHELSTPLSTIAVASAELIDLLNFEPDSSLLGEQAETIQAEVKRCRAIIDKMGARAGQLRAEALEELNLKELAEEVSQGLGNVAPGAVQISYDFSITGLHVPREGLVQSLLALVRNALDATNGTGPVTLDLQVQGGKLCCTVTDSGSGISEEHLRKIREPFFTTKEPGAGMGLGLFLVDLFSKRYGGSLEIHSDTNRGTEAVMRIRAVSEALT